MKKVLFLLTMILGISSWASAQEYKKVENLQQNLSRKHTYTVVDSIGKIDGLVIFTEGETTIGYLIPKDYKFQIYSGVKSIKINKEKIRLKGKILIINIGRNKIGYDGIRIEY